MVRNLQTKRWKHFVKKIAFKWLMVLHEHQPLKVWLKDQIDLAKEDMTRALIMSTSYTSVQKWCEKASEAAYTRNISYHRAIKMTPNEAVYGIKSHGEC